MSILHNHRGVPSLALKINNLFELDLKHCTEFSI